MKRPTKQSAEKYHQKFFEIICKSVTYGLNDWITTGYEVADMVIE
jgi:hypothetical protein